jgi:hypothetical protein
MDSYPVVGAGHYGIVVQSKPTEVLKLFKDYQDCEVMKKEARIQQDVYNLLKQRLPQVQVPPITVCAENIVTYQGSKYLYGIGMKYLEPPVGFDVQVHVVLGYKGSDIDTVWGMHIGEPVSATNPPRGFFASSYTLEDIWEDEGSSMTIEDIAYQMGKAHRLMLDHGILPIDLEWVWSQGSLWVIDFGLCEYGWTDPCSFLENGSSNGLKHDFYVPHAGDRGYEEFMRGYVEDHFHR